MRDIERGFENWGASMAVTKGHGNPDWTRDGVILALDLYFRCGASIPGDKDPRVVELSEVLQRLPIHPVEKRKDSFRNPDGVAFKLQNLRQVASGKGLGNVSKVDREVWAAFGSKPGEARAVAQQILQGVPAKNAATDSTPAEDIEFNEGRLLTVWHVRRERSPRFRKSLIKARLKVGELKCDACGWHASGMREELAEAGFEAHHLLPLAMAGESSTKVKDAALLCATCHRLAHRWIARTGDWLSLDGIKKLVARRPSIG